MLSLKSFSVKHKNKVIYDCNFIELESERNAIFTTLLIGENGAGKSYLLRIISDFIRLIHLSKNSKNDRWKEVKYDQVKLEYFLNGDSYCIEKSFEKISFSLLEEKKAIDEIQLPNKVLAFSFMVNDKFFFSGSQYAFYRYLGVRATSNASYTSSIQKNLLSAILKSLTDEFRMEKIKKCLNFLSISNNLVISYKLSRKTLFTHGINKKTLLKKINAISNRKSFISDYKIIDMKDRVNFIVQFCREVESFYNEDSKSIELKINVKKPESKSLEIIEKLEDLESLEIVSSPEIDFVKNEKFNFEHTSSGEKHFLYTMINLIAEIEKDTLVLIDEPELSLHPSWQMGYIDKIKELTEGFHDSHCILATHSHFLVSDLDPETSSLVTLKQDKDGNRISELINYDTHAWSAENILYSVFKLRTSRNFYFEKDISKLLALISNASQNFTEMNILIEKLSKYRFDDDDPLNEVLDGARKYIMDNSFD